uniref:Uncharacterized protein n=1 Tax=Fagus sylvatica TaxID=28930 RepID=A0A2N9HR43_FAGSY
MVGLAGKKKKKWAWFFGKLGLPQSARSLPVKTMEVTHPCRSRPGRERPTPRPSLPPGEKKCRARSLPVWRSPIRADLGLASPSSPNEFELAKKGSPKVELGLEVVEPCRLVAEKILVAEINLK